MFQITQHAQKSNVLDLYLLINIIVSTVDQMYVPWYLLLLMMWFFFVFCLVLNDFWLSY
jgi:hypothetical protein